MYWKYFKILAINLLIIQCSSYAVVSFYHFSIYTVALKLDSSSR